MLYDAEKLAGLELRWGKGFMSPGGAEELEALLAGADLSGLTGLDFGCGLGGYTNLLVSRYGAGHVIGVDRDETLIARARQRAAGGTHAPRPSFLAISPEPLPFEDRQFDFVLAKEVLVRIPDKRAVLSEFLRVLKPRGRLYLSDWYRADAPPTREMAEWLAAEGYAMASLGETSAMLERLGFEALEAIDRNDWFRDFAEDECRRLEADGAAHARLGARKMRSLIRTARQRALLAAQGQLRPGHIRARKPG